MRSAVILSLGLVASVSACTPSSEATSSGGKSGGRGAGPSAPLEAEATAVAVSQRPNLQWKRHGALENDLAQALALPGDQLCSEFGREPCIRGVHLASLGGNDPFKQGLLEPSAEPLAVTPVVVDRVLLSACGKRAALDRDAGEGKAEVFTDLDLDAKALDADDPGVAKAVTSLYRRFLARNPDAHEIATVATLVRDDADKPVSALEFATLACFAVGSSAEFLFF